MTLRPLQVLGFLLLLLELPAGAIEFGPRTWTSADGRELQAQLISADDTAAQLKLTTTGKTVPVPLTSLSDGDLAYIAEWIEARKTYWGIEVLSAEYPSSYRTEPTGAGTTRQTIKPMMGKPDDILILLTLKVTPPPPGVPASVFDAAGMKFKVSTGAAGLVGAAPKYIVPPDPKEKAGEDGSVERRILYQAPKGAKPAEIKYKENPTIGL